MMCMVERWEERGSCRRINGEDPGMLWNLCCGSFACAGRRPMGTAQEARDCEDGLGEYLLKYLGTHGESKQIDQSAGELPDDSHFPLHHTRNHTGTPLNNGELQPHGTASAYMASSP